MKVDLTKNVDIIKYVNVLEKRVEYVQEKLTDDVLNELKTNTPKRTGKLANSYSVESDEKDLIIKNDAGYCLFVNNGTSHQQGQHFIEKSVELAKLNIPKHSEEAKKINN